MTSRPTFSQSKHGNLAIQFKYRFVISGLCISILTLLLSPGCDSNSQTTATNHPRKDSTSSNDIGVTDKPEAKAQSRADDEQNAIHGKQENTADPPGISDNATGNQVVDRQKDNSAADQASAAATKSVETEKSKATDNSPPFKTFELLASMEASFSSVHALAFAPDGKTLVTCGDTPKIWSIGAAEPSYEFENIYPLTGTVIEPEAVAISHDGKLLAFAGGDGIIHVFDFASREAKHEIKANDAGIVSLSFSNDATKLVSSGYDGKAKIWNVETGEMIATCAAQKERRVRSALAPDGSFLVTAGQEAEIWDASSGEKKAKLDIGEPRAVGVWNVDISADGKKIVTGDATRDFENAALVWSADTGKLEATLKHEYGVGLVAFSPDGQWLATGDMNGAARIWRLSDNQLMQTINSDEVFNIEAIEWTPDSKVLAVSSDGTIRFWGPPGALNLVESADGNKTEDGMPDDSENASDSNVENAKEKQPDSMPAPTKQPVNSKPPTPIVNYDAVKPISVAEAAQIFSARDFQAPFKEPPSLYATSKSSGYMIDKPFDDVTAGLEKTFGELKWEELAREDSTEKNISYYLRNKQLLLACKVREERKNEVRVDVNVLGNVDIRSIPKLDPQEVSFDMLDYSVYKTNSDVDAIMSHYDKLLTAAGWQKYVGFDSPGEGSSDWHMSRYRNRGVGLNVSASQREGDKYASIFCEMLDEDVPTPSNVSGYELDDHLFRQRFVSAQPVTELTTFFVDEMKQTGWILAHGKSFNGTQAGMVFTRPDHEPVYLDLRQREDGQSEAYMAEPTRQVSRAMKGEFEVEYQDSLPLGQTQMHSVDYRAIPFNNPLDDGSGRTIAESVFFNTNASLEDNIEFYRNYFAKQGWEAGDRNDKLIGDKLQSAVVVFTKGDATIELSERPWGEDTNRINIEGNGIWFPGTKFCHMMARPAEAMDIE